MKMRNDCLISIIIIIGVNFKVHLDIVDRCIFKLVDLQYLFWKPIKRWLDKLEFICIMLM